jgi:hypothetical protein
MNAICIKFHSNSQPSDGWRAVVQYWQNEFLGPGVLYSAGLFIVTLSFCSWEWMDLGVAVL